MADAVQITMTPEEFFAWEPPDQETYELVDGHPLKMMTGASESHDRIVTNVIISLGNQLRGSPCRPTTDDIALRTGIQNIRRPDVMVTCGEPSADSYEAHDARLIVEVLSPSNAGLDWQRKLEEYRRVASIAYILLIDPKLRGATLLTRDGPAWTATDYDNLEETIELPEISCRLAMNDLFDGLPPEGQSSKTGGKQPTS